MQNAFAIFRIIFCIHLFTPPVLFFLHQGTLFHSPFEGLANIQVAGISGLLSKRQKYI
jgi:hypothetical protein